MGPKHIDPFCLISKLKHSSCTSMNSNYFFSMLLLLIFWITAFPNDAMGRLAKPGCSDTCGKVPIPFPFGIGPNCAINQSYIIVCTSSKPYLSKLNLEVLNVSLDKRTITVNSPINYSCSSNSQTGALTSSWNSSNLAGTPFFFSKSYNKMMLFGCGYAVLSQNKTLTGCTTSCEFNRSREISSCYGVNFCETTNIPFFLTKYHLSFTVSRFNTKNCSAAFLADQNWLSAENCSELSLQHVPVVLAWTIQSSDLDAIRSCSPRTDYLNLESGVQVETFVCAPCFSVDPENTNPYLIDGCGSRFINGRSGGSETKNSRAAIVGVVTSVGVLFLIAANFAVYKLVKRKRERKIKEKYFKRNGGLLLQQQLSADEGVIEKTRIFTADELEKASDGFNANLILGRGGQGTVYKGMLTDGRLVAIKKSIKVNESQLEQFINEVVILAQINHRNVVKLLGCCLETEVPVLVYELIPNGTLYSLIHNQDDDDFPFTWNLRLRIARDIAGAVAYLHSAVSIPIYHRDIKSSNVLLDERYIAKVSDFGTSKSVAIDKTHLTTQVKGTFGYLDPEYFQSSQFTEKSDVYSFGVVLVELLTRKKPISWADQTEEDGPLSLATRFLMCMDENCLNNILDPQVLVLDQSNEKEIIAMAKLAQRCLNLKGKSRPTMKEVTIELESIKLSATRSTIVEENFHSQRFNMEGESESFVCTDTNHSWTTEIDSIRLASDADPLIIHNTV